MKLVITKNDNTNNNNNRYSNTLGVGRVGVTNNEWFGSVKAIHAQMWQINNKVKKQKKFKEIRKSDEKSVNSEKACSP